MALNAQTLSLSFPSACKHKTQHLAKFGFSLTMRGIAVCLKNDGNNPKRKGSDRRVFTQEKCGLRSYQKIFLRALLVTCTYVPKTQLSYPSILSGYSWLCPNMMPKLTDLKQRDGLVAHDPMEQKKVRQGPAERHIFFSLLGSGLE